MTNVRPESSTEDKGKRDTFMAALTATLSPRLEPEIIVPGEDAEVHAPCQERPEKLVECSRPEPTAGPTYTLPFVQPIGLQELELRPAPSLACVSLADSPDRRLRAVLSLDMILEQRWFFQSLTIADLSSTLSLAPNETISFQSKSTQRKHFEQSAVDSVEGLESSEATTIDKDVLNVLRSSSTTKNWTVGTNATVSVGYASASVSTSKSKTVNSLARNASESLNETTRKSSNNLKTLRKTEITQATDETLEEGISRTVSNPYKDRSLLIKIYELTKEYCVETALVDYQLSLVLEVGGFVFDAQFILENGDFLSEALLDTVMQAELATALETASAVDTRGRDRERRAQEIASTALRYLFDVPNVFGLPADNDPATSFTTGNTALASGNSALGDAIQLDIAGTDTGDLGKIFTALNVHYKLYEAIERPPAQPIERVEGIDRVDLALAIESYVAPLWSAVSGGRLGNILDDVHTTEVFRRLSGFLSLVSPLLKPLVEPASDRFEAQSAERRAAFVVDRVVRHLDCHHDYYAERFLDYAARTTRMVSVKSFAERAARTLGSIAPQYFDIEATYVRGKNVVVPLKFGRKSILNLLRQNDEDDYEEIKLGRQGSVKVAVPCEGIHIEVVPGECELPDVPNSFEVRGNISFGGASSEATADRE